MVPQAPGTQQPNYRRSHPKFYTKAVKVRFYPPSEGEPPMFVRIGNAVYRREEDQEEARLMRKFAELEGHLARTLDPEALHLIWHLQEIGSELHSHEVESLCERLKKYLPTHAVLIEHVCFPEPESIPDWPRQARCCLPGE